MAIGDYFKNAGRRIDAPARNAAAVVPDDNNDLPEVPRALYIGVSGDLQVIFADQDASVTLANVPVGVLPVQVKRILAASTTASGVIALW